MDILLSLYRLLCWKSQCNHVAGIPQGHSSEVPSKFRGEVLLAQNAIFRPFGINNLPKAEIEYSPVAHLGMLWDVLPLPIQWRASIRVLLGHHRLRRGS